MQVQTALANQQFKRFLSMHDHGMPLRTHGRNERPYFLFCVAGLSARNAILLKSMMRLLHGTTRHDWLYSPSGKDLAVVAADTPDLPDAPSSDPFKPAGPVARAFLWAGNGGEQMRFRIALPLHCKELEAELNRVGDWLVAQPAAAAEPMGLPAALTASASDSACAHAPAAAPAVPVLLATPATPATPVEAGADLPEPTGVFQLLCWPPVAFLSTPERAKAATLLLKAPIALDVLARRAGMSVQECQQFILELPRVKRITPVMELLASDALFNAPSQFPSDAAPTAISTAKPVGTLMALVGRSGLLGRIRERLGLKP